MVIKELVSSIRVRLGEGAVDLSDRELLAVSGDRNHRTIQSKCSLDTAGCIVPRP